MSSSGWALLTEGMAMSSEMSRSGGGRSVSMSAIVALGGRFGKRENLNFVRRMAYCRRQLPIGQAHSVKH